MRPVTDRNELDAILDIAGKVVSDPNPLFNFRRDRFRHFYYTDSAEALNGRFYAFLKLLCEMHGEKTFYLLTLEPNPITYFFRHFGRYPAFEFGPEDSSDTYKEVLLKDPGNSPADAIAHNGRVITLFPRTLSWFIAIVHPSDLAMIATREALPSGVKFPSFLTDEQYNAHIQAIIEYAKAHARGPN
jgi:hypothetical protein